MKRYNNLIITIMKNAIAGNDSPTYRQVGRYCWIIKHGKRIRANVNAMEQISDTSKVIPYDRVIYINASDDGPEYYDYKSLVVLTYPQSIADFIKTGIFKPI